MSDIKLTFEDKKHLAANSVYASVIHKVGKDIPNWIMSVSEDVIDEYLTNEKLIKVDFELSFEKENESVALAEKQEPHENKYVCNYCKLAQQLIKLDLIDPELKSLLDELLHLLHNEHNESK